MQTEIQSAVLRPVRAEDAGLFIDFFGSFSERNRYLFTPHAVDPESLREMVAGTIGNPQFARFILTVCQHGAETMVGYVYFWDWHTGVPWLGIGLREGFQEMGLGTRMMAHAVEHARAHTKGGILLSVKKENVRAQGLYKKFGYEWIGEDKRGENLMILRF
jgi:ribosomal protein S18 acetylase RimI-like enzyme